jgi:hypothetical protein
VEAVDESATGSVYSFPSVVTAARAVPGVGFVIPHNPLGDDQEVGRATTLDPGHASTGSTLVRAQEAIPAKPTSSSRDNAGCG